RDRGRRPGAQLPAVPAGAGSSERRQRTVVRVMLGTPHTGLSDESRNRQIVLDRGTSDSGGTREQLLTSMALEAKLKQLANQLTHQYLVTYSRPESLIPPQRITVAATKAGLTARGTPVRVAPKAAR